MEARAAYRHCRKVAFGHYENFPVASLLLPAPQRDAIAAVYAFARQADDYADEPEWEGRRLASLDRWEAQLHQEGNDPVFVALKDAMGKFELPAELFVDLLSAFRQDVTRRRYADFADVKDYCRRSANPVGRLVLRVFGLGGGSRDERSDHICTALQLTNFWQDLASDAQSRDRVYLPRGEMIRFGVKESWLLEGRFDRRLRDLMRFQVERTEALFGQGESLCQELPGRLGFEIKLTVAGGRAILGAIRRLDYDTLTVRPALTKSDWLKIFFKALL